MCYLFVRSASFGFCSIMLSIGFRSQASIKKEAAIYSLELAVLRARETRNMIR